MNKTIVIGSGFSGSILARKIAEELEQKVLIVAKRSHIGGNMYDTTTVRGSVVAMEYPLTYNLAAEVGNIPYYPVVTEESSVIYQQYQKEAVQYKSLFLCSRLAEFKYYNMDVCIEHALTYFKRVREII